MPLKVIIKIESARFTLVVILGLLIDLVIAYVFSVQIGLPLSISAIFGFISAAFFNYILHELWTFQDGEKQLSKKRVGRYLFALLVTLSIRLIMIEILSRIFDPKGLELMILIAATGVSFIANYLVSKFMVFRPCNPC